ncbi:hypothetical protein Unana1_08919, partial [Umbelopsis nana]
TKETRQEPLPNVGATTAARDSIITSHPRNAVPAATSSDTSTGKSLGVINELTVPPRAIDDSTVQRDRTSLPFLEPVKSRFMGADSAIAFPRSLGVHLNTLEPPRLHSFAWNTGIRSERRLPCPMSMVRLICPEDCEYFSNIYFEEVHPLFGILDRGDYFQQCNNLWSSGRPSMDFEAIFCGVIALGSLFSRTNTCVVEAELVEHSRVILELSVSQPGETLSLNHVAAWILRTIYLRSTTRPHVSWMSSCITMYLAESIGLHKEFSNARLAAKNCPQPLAAKEMECRRRVFWVAWALNRLISADYGRSKVQLDNIECRTFPSKAGDYTNDIVRLARLIPDSNSSSQEFAIVVEQNKILDQLFQMHCRFAAFMLLKTDVCFNIYRRLRLSNAQLTGEQTTIVLSIATDGLEQAKALASQRCPMWNVISTPFQCVCVLLSIDTRESLAVVDKAMSLLDEMVEIYDTHLARESARTARHLIQSLRTKKVEELDLLEKATRNTETSPLTQTSSGNELSAFADILEWPSEDLSDWTQFFK